METVHAYTPDQNLIGQLPQEERAGAAGRRSIIVITETGASSKRS